MTRHYKTPLKKLVTFFRTSRDGWKRKTLQAKKELKLYKNRIKFLETSTAKLKQEVLSLKKEIKDIYSRISNTPLEKIHDSGESSEKKYSNTIPSGF